MIVCIENFSSESFLPFTQFSTICALVSDIRKFQVNSRPWKFNPVSFSSLVEQVHIVFDH
jgi:hypothetical protein